MTLCSGYKNYQVYYILSNFACVVRVDVCRFAYSNLCSLMS